MPIPHNHQAKIVQRVLMHKHAATWITLHKALLTSVSNAITQSLTVEQRATLDALPKEWLQPATNWVTLTDGDRRFSEGLASWPRKTIGHIERAFFDTLQHIPYDLLRSPNGIKVPKDALDSMFAVLTECRKFDTRVEEDESALRNMLAGIPGLKALPKVWPEGRPFYVDLLPTKAGNLPAIVVANINERFGLPIPEKSAHAPMAQPVSEEVMEPGLDKALT